MAAACWREGWVLKNPVTGWEQQAGLPPAWSGLRSAAEEGRLVLEGGGDDRLLSSLLLEQFQLQ